MLSRDDIGGQRVLRNGSRAESDYNDSNGHPFGVVDRYVISDPQRHLIARTEKWPIRLISAARERIRRGAASWARAEGDLPEYPAWALGTLFAFGI